MNKIRSGFAAILLLATTLAALIASATPLSADHYKVPPPYEVDCNLRISLGAGCDVSVQSN